MGIRDKFKATTIKTLKKEKQSEDRVVGSSSSNDFLDIKEGMNKFRIYPSHDTEPYYAMKAEHWITVENDEGKAGRRTVLNARHHGNAKRDIIEAYMEAAKNHLIDTEDEKAEEKIGILTGWNTGLQASFSWVCYAARMEGKDKKEFGLLQYSKSVRDGMNNISLVEDEDEVMDTEPFTDPDEGLPVTIVYDKKAKNTERYKVQIKPREKAVELTDEELETYTKLTPLSKKYKNVYTKQMFDLAVDGILYFDENNDIGFTDTDEWEELMNEIKEELGLDEDKKGKSKSSKTTSKPSKGKSKPAPEPEEEDDDEEEEDDEEEIEEEDDEDEEEGDQFDAMDRSELKKFIKTNKLSSVVVKTSSKDDEIRDLIRKASAEVEEEDDEEEEQDEPAISLADIKAQLRAKKEAKKGK